jgi:NAD(P)-dependent dehydrogenase (short-subunit alcohol dehydrogenase family)
MEIRNNVFIVTGGASGLGGATSTMLARGGGKVIIADVQADKGEALARELGENARYMKCDVSSEADAQAVVAAAAARGPLRGLVNCAGVVVGEKTVGKDGPHALASFARVVNINLIGSFNMIRIVADAAAYSASKGGIVGMTLPIARDLSRNGIRCMTIAPGLFETPMLLGMPKEVQDSLGKQVPFPSRLGKPAEYANLVAAILGNVMLNGETIRLDGAIRLQPK